MHNATCDKRSAIERLEQDGKVLMGYEFLGHWYCRTREIADATVGVIGAVTG